MKPHRLETKTWDTKIWNDIAENKQGSESQILFIQEDNLTFTAHLLEIMNVNNVFMTVIRDERYLNVTDVME